MFGALTEDFRHAGRSLLRSPGFLIVAVVTLGVALGAAVAIFTVVNATMLTPPAYPESDRLVLFATNDNSGPATSQELLFLRSRSRTLTVIAGQRSTPGWNLVAGDRAEFVEGLEVTDGYFEVHNVSLLAGRGISPAESQVGGPRSVVLSEPLWRRLFGARNVLGESVEIGGRLHEIVGIAPAQFRSIPAADVWTSLRLSPQGNAGTIRILGRIASNVSYADAVAELNGMRGELRALSPDDGDRIALVTWRPHREWFAARSRELMSLLLGSVGALLLVACVNVAGLQVARGLARAREFAARAALGASRFRLFRQAFAESVLLAAAASAVGIVVAAASTEALLNLLPIDLVTDLLAGQSVAIDRRVLAAALAMGAAAAVISGVAPALASAYVDLRTATSDAFRVTTNRRALWLRRGFAIAQIAVAVTLLIGAGLLVRTFATLRSAELGFVPADIVVGEMAIQGDQQWDVAARNLFIEQTLSRIRQIDGVESATVASAVPVDRPLNLGVQAHGDTRVLDRSNVDSAYATPGYFDLLGIPLRAGRVFDDGDAPGSMPVAVVNASFAKAFFGRENVVAETIEIRSFGDPVRLIVGVVGDVRARSGSSFGTGGIALASAPPPALYVPLAQLSTAGFDMVHQFTTMRWVIRTRDGVPGIPEAVREAVRVQDPRRPFRRFIEMEQIIGRDVGVHRFLTMMLSIFACLAVSLAAIGLYALISQLVSQRRHEIGIRLTLGATGSRIVRIFMTEALGLTVLGVALGLVAAPSLTAVMEMFLVGVTPLDTVTFVAVPALLLTTTIVATSIPARRAALTDPAMSLRSE